MRESARTVAVRILQRQFSATGTPVVPSRFTPFRKLSRRDRSLTLELVQGVARQLGLLDYYLGCLSRRPLVRIDPVVRWILRLGLYQLEFLQIPARAAVHQSVELCRFFRHSSAGAFTNGLLRSFQKARPKLPCGDSLEALSVRWSHPKWLVRRYLQRFGLSATRDWLERNNQLPQPILWINQRRVDLKVFLSLLESEGIDYESDPRSPSCIRVATSFAVHELYRSGYCFFLDPSSLEVALQAAQYSRGRAAELCAAPGNKSFVWANLTDPAVTLVCADISYRRLREMQGRAQLFQLSELALVGADLTQRAPFSGPVFDFVLLDVPCSGLGTLRSHPEIRWLRTEEDLARYSRRQETMLSRAFETLRPGGEILYATCSTEPEENEQVIEGFLAENSAAIPAGEYWRSFPANSVGQGFFTARIRRR